MLRSAIATSLIFSHCPRKERAHIFPLKANVNDATEGKTNDARSRSSPKQEHLRFLLFVSQR